MSTRTFVRECPDPNRVDMECLRQRVDDKGNLPFGYRMELLNHVVSKRPLRLSTGVLAHAWPRSVGARGPSPIARGGTIRRRRPCIIAKPIVVGDGRIDALIRKLTETIMAWSSHLRMEPSGLQSLRDTRSQTVAAR